MGFSLPSRAGNGCTPQATMVKLIQLGEGDSPQCGESPGSIFEKLLHRKTFYFACGQADSDDAPKGQKRRHPLGKTPFFAS
ncbi:MAG: hypothetical protein SOW15_09765 [Ruminococcus callidus]|nr:hypothetical protein [Ruminococcus callidus]